MTWTHVQFFLFMSTIYILKLVIVVLLELYILKKKTVQAYDKNTQSVNNNLPIYLSILILI